jgi:hypothetical protein
MSSRQPLRGLSPSVRNGRIASTQAQPSPPSKISATPQSLRRLPSSSTFNPAISDSVPSYPKHDINSLKQKGKPTGLTRYFGNTRELSGVREETEHEGNNGGGPGPALRRVNSITIRRQPSSADFHSGQNKPPVHAPPLGQRSHGEDPGHIHPLGSTTTSSLPARQPFPAQVQVTVPTVDGFFLEFNPLLVSPAALNELEGITEDAKRQAREEMVRLVKEAVSKWTI